ncbi:MAG: hypothetical protein WBC06_06500 [Chitinophagaceae bacterium]
MQRYFLLFLICFISELSIAQLQTVSPESNKSISPLLNADGTINALNFSKGTFTAEGYKISQKENGQPVFFKETGTTVAGDENWAPDFALTGVDGQVFTILVDGNDVYVGGTFSKAGGIAALHIAKWSGNVWSKLGNGLGGAFDRVTSIKKFGNNIFASSLTSVSKWDGSTWTTVGTISDAVGPNLTIGAIDIDASGNLYVVGSFIKMNGITVNGIAKWNGTTWSALGTGIDIGSSQAGVVVAVEGTNVFIGGGFSSVSGVAAQSIAKWNGSNWSALGSGIIGPGGVTCLAVMGTDLYVGSNNMTSAGGVPVNNIAKWNGTTWSALGNGLNSVVHTLAVLGSDLYAGGNFSQSGSTPVNKIAKWNGLNWSDAGNGLSMYEGVFALGISSQVFFAGGGSGLTESLNMHNVARWNGSSWVVVGNGTNDYINCIAIDGNNIYIGGKFTEAGGLKVNRIAKWDGVKWDSLGGGFPQGEVLDIAIIGNKLYAGGTFSNAPFSNVNYLGVWDGVNWSAVGSGVSYQVFALATNGTDLYAGGNFAQAGGLTCNNIAKWDGANWSTLANGTNDIVKDIKIAPDGTLYAGGNFTVAGATAASRIAKWNGSNWSAIGLGVNNFVNVIALNAANEIYIGGAFDIANGVGLVNHIAKFNGTTWVTLSGGVSSIGNVFSILTRGNDVYVGGDFSIAGTVPANNIAKWDGSNWSPLGAGLGKDPASYAIPMGLAINCNSLYAVGYFATAGDKRSDRFARYWMDGLPGVSINTSNTTVCSGTNVTFNATPLNGGASPVYQWQVNGTNVGTNSSVYSTSTLPNNAVVQVKMSGNSGCISPISVTSNNITMTINAIVTPSVNISTVSTTVCSGANVTFNAVPSNAGTAPDYQWQVNGTNSGTNSNSFTTSTLTNNAQVKVNLTANGGCFNPANVTSNVLSMLVNPLLVPSVNISGTTTVNQGAATIITATPVNSGNNPTYTWEDSTSTHNWQPINGSNAATISYTPLLNGDKLRCQLTSNAICVSPSSVKSNILVFTVNPATAINPVPAISFGIKCYPNPVHELLIIDSLHLTDRWQTAAVSSIDGKKMMPAERITNRTRVSINVALLPAGQYFVVLQRAKGPSAYIKFIKK